MASKINADDLLAELGSLGTDEQPKPKPSSSSKPTAASTAADEVDPLAELENLAQQAPKSRPHTPRVGSNVGNASPRKSTDGQAPVQTRKSGESTRGFHQGVTPGGDAKATQDEEKTVETPAAADGGGGGGWWGAFTATASAAVKQAEALAKEIQSNEEAQRWAEQVKGNVGALRTYGGELRSKALPTFTNILHTLAPPISSHERLQIHITHDFVGYPSLDPLIYQTFSRVMAQVEGGDLMVIQRGQEAAPRRGSEAAGYTGSAMAGWSDGPWWKQDNEKRDLAAVKGLREGTKLAKVSAESYSTDYFAAKGGVEEAAKQATEVLSETNPTRSSDIFLAIQAISYEADKDLFGGPSTPGPSAEGAIEPVSEVEEQVAFAIYLHDPIHGIAFHAITQAMPQKWVAWLDNLTSRPDAPSTDGEEFSLPDDIRQIVENGGVDPREWVSEWVEELLALGVGIVAQRYVARRMGVGEGGIGRGKKREETVDAGAGEAARAL